MSERNLVFRPYELGGVAAELRLTHQQTNYLLPYRKGGARVAGTGTTSTDHDTKQIWCSGWSFQNRSGSAAVVGLAARVANRYWVAGQYTDSGKVWTDDTADAQDTGTDDFVTEVAATANDGFYVSCDIPFNLLTFNVSTASVKGTTVARSLSVPGEDGVLDAITTALWVHDGAADDYATGENIISFSMPSLWTPPAHGDTTNLTTYTGAQANHPQLAGSRYPLLVKSTDAPDTTAALVKAMEVWVMYLGTEAVADNATIEHLFPRPFPFPFQCDAVSIYCSSAGIQNRGTLFLAEG